MSNDELSVGQKSVLKEKKESKDTNDYKELFGKLRQAITTSRDGYNLSLSQTRDLIEKREEEVRLLKIRKDRLLGAIETSEAYLKAVLPSNNKIHGK